MIEYYSNNIIKINVNSINGNLILSNNYDDHTSINSIRIDILKIIPFSKFKLYYNTYELNQFLNYIKDIKIDSINHEEVRIDNIINLTIIFYNKIKIVDGMNINILTNDKLIIFNKCIKHKYIFNNIEILKIIKVLHNFNKDYEIGDYILTNNNEIYKINSLRIIEMIDTYIYNIFYNKKFNKINYLIKLKTDNNLIIYLETTNLEYIININNICDKVDIKNIRLYDNEIHILTYNNTLYILYNIIDYKNQYIKYDNVKKIVYNNNISFNKFIYLILTFEGIIYSSKNYYNNILKNNKFLDIKISNSKAIFCAINFNNKILIFGEGIKLYLFNTLNKINELINNIDEIYIFNGFIVIINNNYIIIFGYNIKKYMNTEYIKIDNNFKKIFVKENGLYLFTYNNELIIYSEVNSYVLTFNIKIDNNIFSYDIKNIYTIDFGNIIYIHTYSNILIKLYIKYSEYVISTTYIINTINNIKHVFINNHNIICITLENKIKLYNIYDNFTLNSILIECEKYNNILEDIDNIIDIF